MLEPSPFAGFSDAAGAVLRHLHERVGLGLWMVTRVEADEWIVLEAEDHHYGVEPGQVFRWSDSCCSRMIAGLGPCIAPRASEVPAYATAPIADQVQIGAYIGLPLMLEQGNLFGTLCAIDPEPQPQAIVAELPLVQLSARLLCTILQQELRAVAGARIAERAQAEALTDQLTGLFNRRGWDRLLVAEESRCRRFGHPACVVAIDLDGLKTINDTQGHHRGDQLLQEAARVLKATIRSEDVAARTGGDEFFVLATQCNEADALVIAKRIKSALDRAGVIASVGMAPRHPDSCLIDACQAADRAMYAAKRSRRLEPVRSIRSSAQPVG